jgi:prephenate dehydratase
VRYAYLGPPGTFTEAALLQVAREPDAELVSRATVSEALDDVRTGATQRAMVPLESSIEGSVMLTLDELAFGPDVLTVRAEVSLPITMALLAFAGRTMSDVTTVLSHPHAAAQCRQWLSANLPGAAVVPTGSTAEAAVRVAEGEAGLAALGAPVASAEYGLAILADDVGDFPDAATRFVLVGPSAEAPPAPTGADRTSVVAFIGDDHPGALLELLQEFAVRGVNLTRIESRPTKSGLGRYCFFVDCEGHVAEARVGEALSGLRRKCVDVRFLGSYARAGDRPTPQPAGATDADFDSAAAWLATLRD